MIEILIATFIFALTGAVACISGLMIGRKLGHEDQLAVRENDLEQARYWLNVIAIQGGDIQEPWSAEIARRGLNKATPLATCPKPPLLLTKQVAT